MKKRSKFLALSLIALLTMGIFAGCGNDEQPADTAGSATSASTESSAAPESDKATDSDKENNPIENTAHFAHNADIIGTVTATDGKTLTIDVYEPHTTDLDLLAVTGSDLTATGASEMIEVADVVNIKKVSDGGLVASSADVIQNGDMVAVVTNEDGSKELLILEIAE